MTPAGAAAAGPAGVLAPTRLEVTATVGGVQVAAASRDRLRVPDGLRRTEVRDHGLVGILYAADGPPRPGVLLLGGAEGGVHEDDAALLAAHGYAVLALAYHGAPAPLRLAFEPALSEAILPAATIPAEQINGPVLLISSTDDQGYGPAFHDIAARRLASCNHQHPWQHLLYPHAGHLIAAPPYWPTTTARSPGPGITFHHGGNPEANAHACAAGWQQILRFFRTAFTDGYPRINRLGGSRSAARGRALCGPAAR